MSDETGTLGYILENTFSQYGYPQALLDEYDQMECLSDHRDCETFLCQKKGTNELVIAKCFANSFYDFHEDNAVGRDLHCNGIPRYIGEYHNEKYTCILREYIEGTPLSELVTEKSLSQQEITNICLKLCDILIELHSQNPPIIHRDIKPENIIIQDDGSVYLIDLDIARTFKPEAESDTFFFGTKGYAPPEQYGFMQTDARADIYSFGILLRFLLTGSTKENKNIKIYKPLQKIIDKCTAFAPEKRFSDMNAVKKAMLAANPKVRTRRMIGISVFALLLCAALVFGGIKLYRYITYTPFTPDHIPDILSDEERMDDAVSYLKNKYGTTLFDEKGDIATMGFLKQVLVEMCGLESDYVHAAAPDGIPCESDTYFLPWVFDDDYNLPRDIAVYSAVKAYDKSIIEDFSSLKDDNGIYPGVRLANDFAEKNGILTGANRPFDITVGDAAIIFANTDRVLSK